MSEKIQGEDAVEVKQVRLQNVLESITDGLAIFDRDWVFTYLSEHGAEMIGLDAKDLIGTVVWDSFPYAEQTQFGPSFRKAVESGSPVHFEEYYPEPLEMWIECHCYPSDEGLAVYFRDVTDRKKSEAEKAALTSELKAQFELFDTTLSAITDFAYTFDKDSRFTFVNKALLDLWGLTLDQAVGKNFHDLQYPPELADRLHRQIQQVFETGQGLSDETPYTSPTGEGGYYEYIFRPVFADDGTVRAVAGSTRDISQHKAMESQITAQAERLEELSQRKDEFLAMLSHELRNPLAAICSALDLYNMHSPPENAHQRASMDVIGRQARIMTRLVDDLLEVSRVASGTIHLQRGVVDIRQIVERAVESTRPLVDKKRQTLHMDLSPEPVWASCDPLRIDQVLVNLLTNAAKFSPEESPITVSCSKQDGFAVVSVLDQGVGMSPALMASMYDLFTQAEATIYNSQGGLGIGLHLAKNIVNLHGGTLEALSPPPDQAVGSVFTVKLASVDEP